MFANPKSVASSGGEEGEIKRVPCQPMTDFLMDVGGTCTALSTEDSACEKGSC